MLALSLYELSLIKKLKAVHDVTKLGYLEWCHIYCDFSWFSRFSSVLTDKCSFLCADLARIIRVVLGKTWGLFWDLLYGSSTWLYDNNLNISNHFFSAFSCGGFECHTEHFMNILSLNSLWNCHHDSWQAVGRFRQGL